MHSFGLIEQTAERARSFGFRQLPNGARLYGHVPHIAPEAWLHELHAPLAKQDITELERRIGKDFPAQLRDFFLSANGVDLFSDALSVFGKRTSYVRSGDESRQPYCIVTANTLDRPTHAKNSHIVVGSYRNDGSLLFVDNESGETFRTKTRSKKVLNRWDDFWGMLVDEANRLSSLFDGEGRRLSEGPTTPRAATGA